MSQTRRQAPTRSATWGWSILVAVGAVLMINGAALFLFVADTQIFRTAGILLGGFGLLALIVAVDGLLHRSRWAWKATWAVVTVLAILAVHTLTGGENTVGVWHSILAAAALVGQLLAGTGHPQR